jgi:hypothetical protein
MIKQFTKTELFESIITLLERINPFIITEIEQPETLALFQNFLNGLEPFIMLEQVSSPKQLFQFLKKHQTDFIIIRDDVFVKRKNYLDILLGAICSSSDDGGLWTVSYLNEKTFMFKGKIILCTNKNKQEFKSEQKFKYFGRDCCII